MYGKIYKNWSPYFAGLESREPTYLPTYLPTYQRSCLYSLPKFHKLLIFTTKVDFEK